MDLKNIDPNNITPDDIIKIFSFIRDFAIATSNRLDTWFIPSNFVMGAGLTLGYKTLFGPVEIELSRSNMVDSWAFFVNVGYWF